MSDKVAALKRSEVGPISEAQAILESGIRTTRDLFRYALAIARDVACGRHTAQEGRVLVSSGLMALKAAEFAYRFGVRPQGEVREIAFDGD